MNNYTEINQKVAFIFLFLITFFLGNNVKAQDETIGLLHFDENTSEAYILFTPKKNSSTYLINNCGELINEWSFSETPGATCYLLENGNLLRAGKDSLEIRDWESNLVWSYPTTANGINQHHDIEPLPNGNILCVAGVNFTKDEIVALGRDPENTSDSFRMDRIVELEPVGSHEANLVWEWRFQDHLVQEFDATKPNYGLVIEHPGLVDLNYINSNQADFTHVNAIDYNAELDQIIISPRHLNEILIIDHSTTTEEAAGHTGGNSGIGGDLMWRWGNPAGYQQGTEADQKLFLQHDSKWVEDGYLDEGKISVFNNGGDQSGLFSYVHLLVPTFTDGAYVKESNVFLPVDYDWSWNGIILGDTVREGSQSGVMCLPNGNVIICESSKGQLTEITKSGEHLMTYVNPSGSEIYNQFDVIENKDNLIFRAEKYPTDHPAFEGRDMSPIGIIEDVNANSDLCTTLQSSQELKNDYTEIVNPVIGNRLQFVKQVLNTHVLITDINGRVVFEKENFSGNSLMINLLPSLYLLELKKGNEREILKLIIQ